MAETTTITKPSPIIEASLTNFLKHIDQSQETLIKDLENIQSKSELFIEKSFAN